jgi:hypothetical protein
VGRGQGRGPRRGPYEVGSLSRLYVALSLATTIPFSQLVLEDDETIATYLELIDHREG